MGYFSIKSLDESVLFFHFQVFINISYFLAINIMEKNNRLYYNNDFYPHLLSFKLNLFSESIYRRGARRWRKLYCANGHTFQAKRFNRVNLSLLKVDNLRNLLFPLSIVKER